MPVSLGTDIVCYSLVGCDSDSAVLKHRSTQKLQYPKTAVLKNRSSQKSARSRNFVIFSAIPTTTREVVQFKYFEG